jgi:TonB family protein
MYFDFEDHRPDISRVERAISWREGILISIIVHMAVIILVLVAPDWLPFRDSTSKPQQAVQLTPRPDPPRFVFVQPRVERPVPKPPDRGPASDRDRLARAPEVAAKPANPLPRARGNSPERVDRATPEVPRGQGPEPQPSAAPEPPPEPPRAEQELKLPEAENALALPPRGPKPGDRMSGRMKSGGSLGDALRNLQRYLENEQFDNPQGGGGSFGPEIQFDTKGVEFGPWIRRFIAQVKRNWLIPYAAIMSTRGRVVITFNVHKNGMLTDLSVVAPSPIEAFNNAAVGALSASNPTAPLPVEYPADKAFFTVTFLYNEQQ